MKPFAVPAILFSLFVFWQKTPDDPEQLRIGSYNIYTFGKHGNTQVYNAAKVLSRGNFDLLAIQEVMGTKGEAAIHQLLLFLKDSFQLNYQAVISPDIGSGLGGQERIAFVYKPEIVHLVPVAGKSVQLMDAPENGRDFAFSHWSAGNFNFVLGSGHLYYGNAKQKNATLRRRKQELEEVYSFFQDPQEQFGDEDLIFVGDFNRGALVNDYQSITYDTTRYFIPNIEFFDPALNQYAQVKKQHIQDRGVPNDNPKLVSSTVAQGNTYVYDMIICSKSLLNKYKARRNNGIFNTDFGVISYDASDGIGSIPDACKQPSQNKLKQKYSDHRPVWVRLVLN